MPSYLMLPTRARIAALIGSGSVGHAATSAASSASGMPPSPVFFTLPDGGELLNERPRAECQTCNGNQAASTNIPSTGHVPILPDSHQIKQRTTPHPNIAKIALPVSQRMGQIHGKGGMCETFGVAGSRRLRTVVFATTMTPQQI